MFIDLYQIDFILRQVGLQFCGFNIYWIETVVHKLTSEKQCSIKGGIDANKKQEIGENLEGENVLIDILEYLRALSTKNF